MQWLNRRQVHDKSPVDCQIGVEAVTYDPMGVQLRRDVFRMLIAMWSQYRYLPHWVINLPLYYPATADGQNGQASEGVTKKSQASWL